MRSLDDVKLAAADFLKILESKKSTTATVVGLEGELGAGKTTFTQALAQVLGIRQSLTSPTFVIEKNYEIPHTKSHFKHLVHIDAYRLESPHELTRLGFSEILTDPANLVLIEWPERIGNLMPSSALRLHFTHITPTIRLLTRI